MKHFGLGGGENDVCAAQVGGAEYFVGIYADILHGGGDVCEAVNVVVAASGTHLVRFGEVLEKKHGVAFAAVVDEVDDGIVDGKVSAVEEVECAEAFVVNGGEGGVV